MGEVILFRLRVVAPVVTTTNKTTQLILSYLASQGCFVWRQNVGRVPGRAVPKSQQGIADIIGLMGRGNAGKFIAVEVKMGSDKLNPLQIEFHAEIRRRGGISMVCYSFDDFLTKFKEHL